ncbi:hypothetical protein [Nostoc sp. 'Peltigera membranacea cyanobiont' 232]|uniref:hypothetical protein n=1 Tax=Nostoc sp. 'Peltigera membranacea cyanobiont' 232 TaxID=2014531 RepID=UPI0016762F94|nr:hypothetical protein [Nostoc sp. 'Peltigera membranacea cyanobiont' 232]
MMPILDFRFWILDFGLKVTSKRLLLQSQALILSIMQIWDYTKLPKLVLSGVKEAV